MTRYGGRGWPVKKSAKYKLRNEFYIPTDAGTKSGRGGIFCVVSLNRCSDALCIQKKLCAPAERLMKFLNEMT